MIYKRQKLIKDFGDTLGIQGLCVKYEGFKSVGIEF